MMRKWVGNQLRKIFARRGYVLLEEALVQEWQKQGLSFGASDQKLPEDADGYLTPDHPRLIQLQQAYADFDTRVTRPFLWTEDRLSPRDLQYFRGNNAFLFQIGSMNRHLLGYVLEAYYLRTRDSMGLWDKLEESGDFGAITFTVDHKRVSRDLLDSILEINYLNRKLSLSSRRQFSVLDIGAGYGRLAHRMVNSFPNIDTYLCTDAVPASTFVCEYYLDYLGLTPRAHSVPVTEIEDQLEHRKIDLAVNIHSFSECTLDAIDWWMELISKNEIRYLFIIPNSGKNLLTVDRKDFLPLIEKHGYQRAALDPKYSDPVCQANAANSNHYHIFEQIG